VRANANAGDSRLARETGAILWDGGSAIQECERFPLTIALLDPPKSHILGRARRSPSPEVVSRVR
jgi:hypothetical protein